MSVDLRQTRRDDSVPWPEISERPRRFVLRRLEDVSGVSGVGIVAWGVEFPDGKVILRWKPSPPHFRSTTVAHDAGVASVIDIHGHGGRTLLVWID